ncbi:hypothetical protein Peur_058006 [Populus x canadensis]
MESSCRILNSRSGDSNTALSPGIQLYACFWYVPCSWKIVPHLLSGKVLLQFNEHINIGHCSNVSD